MNPSPTSPSELESDRIRAITVLDYYVSSIRPTTGVIEIIIESIAESSASAPHPSSYPLLLHWSGKLPNKLTTRTVLNKLTARTVLTSQCYFHDSTSSPVRSLGLNDVPECRRLAFTSFQILTPSDLKHARPGFLLRCASGLVYKHVLLSSLTCYLIL